MFIPSPRIAILWLAALTLTLPAGRAALFTLSASGTISLNSTSDSTIPLGTPFEFQLVYDTAAPDFDFETTGSPTPTYGKYTNTGSTPALVSFHYKAGSYEVTVGRPEDFGPGSEILVSFGAAKAIDININAPGFFPDLAGGGVSFHADFNDFVDNSLTSDALPTNTALGMPNFAGESSVTLLPVTGRVITGPASTLAFAPVPEPGAVALVVPGLVALLAARRWRARL